MLKKLCCLLLLWPLSLGAAPRVIVHPGVQQQSISNDQLNRIYAMQLKRWADGTPIRVFALSSQAPLHRTFVIDYFGMRAHQLDRLWQRLLYSGTGRAPMRVADEAEMMALVAKTPGAIGYVDESTTVSDAVVMTLGDAHEEI